METFELLYREYFPRIYSFLYKMCKNESLAEELTQETFYNAFTSFHRFKGQSEIFTWLASIAKHTYFKYLRKNKKRYEDISIDLILDVYCENNHENPETALQKKVIEEGVRKVINKIPDKYKDVVLLRIYADLPFAQVGAALGISENSAKVIYFRAKKMLMEEIKNELNM